MADNIFAKSPVEIATANADARTRSVFEAMQRPDSGAFDFDTLARQTQVPQNIIEAAHAMSGLQGKDGEAFTARFTEAVGQQIAAGKGAGDAVKAVLSEAPEAAEALLQNAIQMVNPQQEPENEGQGDTRSIAGDLARRGWSSVLRGTGMAVEGMGRALNRDPGMELHVQTGPDGEPVISRTPKDGPSEMVENTRIAGDKLREMGEGVAKGISQDANAAMEGSQFKGDLFKPSTWELPENASAEGLAHLTVEVLGSMAPVLLASVATRSPAVAAGVGGSQSAGAGAESAREIIEAAAKDVDEAGVSRLERESPYYQSLIEQGHSPQEAAELTSEAAQKAAAGWAAIPGALGGAATGRLLQAPLASLAGRGFATRVGGTAALSAAEEGAQEVAETVAGRHGVSEATGMDIDLTEGTLNDAVLGAMGGAPVGAVGGLRKSSPQQPAPEPVTGFAPDAAPEPAPGPVPALGMAEPEPAPAPAAPTSAPAGPLSRAAERAPELPEAPAPLKTAGMVDGSKVRLEIPGGAPVEVVFKGETDEGMTFDHEGNPFLITREEIEAGKVSVVPLSPVSEANSSSDGGQFVGELGANMGDAIVEASLRTARGPAPTSDLSLGESMIRAAEQRFGRIDADQARGILEAADEAAQQPDPKEHARRYLIDTFSAGSLSQKAAASQPTPARPKEPAKLNAPAKPTLQKRPFTNAIKVATGGIDPNGPLGQDLRHRGVTPQTAPGLFRSGGAQSLDNLPASEWAEYGSIVGDDGNGYLSEQGIVEALTNEMAGQPVQNTEQAQLQAEADAKAELAELRDRGLDVADDGAATITPELADTHGIIPPPNEGDDFSMGEDRGNLIWKAVRDEELAIGVNLTARERNAVFASLNDNGGRVEDALWSQLEKEPEENGYAKPNQEAVQDPGPPIFESELSEAGGQSGQGAVGQGSERSQSDPGSESEGEPGSGDPASSGSEAQPEPVSPEAAEPPQLQDKWWRTLPKLRHSAKQVGLNKETIGAEDWKSKERLTSIVNERLSSMGHHDLMAEEPKAPEALKTETTPEGEQTLIPGVEPVPDKAKAETAMNKPKRGGSAPADFGLFDTGARDQTDMFSGSPVPIEDARQAQKLRDMRAAGTQAQQAGEPRTPPEWATGELADAWLEGYGIGIAKSADAQEAPTKAEIDQAAGEADPNPTPAQAEAGNYKKGRFSWNGLSMVIETAKGEERRGTDANGEEWSVTMPAHYGDIKRTEGADGDPVDFYMGDDPESNLVVIVNQVDPETGAFDEHKVVLGTHNVDDALKIYRAGFSDGSGEKRLGSYSATDVDSFKGWLKDQDATKEAVPTRKEYEEGPMAGVTVKLDEGWSIVRDYGEGMFALQADKTGAVGIFSKEGPDFFVKVSRSLVRPTKKSTRSPEQIADDMYWGGEKRPDQEPVKKDPPAKTGAKAEYGASNTLVSQERAKELRDRLKAKLRDQLNSGIDPEIMAIGAELAVFHIEAGARRFTNLARAIAADLGTTPANLKPYLRSWYNGARDMMEDHGLSIEDMDEADTVRAIIRSNMLDNLGADQTPEPTSGASERQKITAAFQLRFAQGQSFASIVQARKAAAEDIGRDVTEDDFKMIEEAIEAAIVKQAKQITRGSEDPVAAYDAMVELYAAQPKLAQRTSTSIEQQAYSTPAPLAYLASQLAGIDQTTTVYEPSAGNGMLVVGADNGNITANELNPDRFGQLQAEYPGATLTNADAMAVEQPVDQDVVIANPPFGKVKDAERKTVQFDLVGVDGTTSEIDHAIAFKALDAMKEGGRAVLIVGGHKGDVDYRRDKYRGAQPRKFYKKLYDTYNVTEHFTVDGRLYERQGAAWPVDVIVIEGRNPSKKPYPMKEPPAMYSSWAELKERLDGSTDNLDPRGERSLSGHDPVAQAGETADAGQLSLLSDGPDQQAGDAGSVRGARPGGDGGTTDVGLGSADPNAEPGKSGALAGNGERNPAQQGDGAGNIPGEPDADAGRSAGAGQHPDGDVQRVSEQPLPVEPRKQPNRENTEAETSFQVRYAPRSAAQFAVGTLVPRNMQEAASRALEALEQRVGNIDAYVAGKLGYSPDEMLGTETTQGKFSAEQVDALALAIDNIEEGKGFIIGDQTGVGKGRINAGLIRYAMRAGKTPVFFTVKPGLYGDMIRDLRDIGEQNPEDYVYMTNDGLRGGKSIPLSDDPADRLVSLPKAQNQKAINDLRHTGKLPEGKQVVFTTYDQMNTVKKSVTDRMNAMAAIAPNAMFIMDESHEAGGTGSSRPKKPGDPEPRSVFIRGLLRESVNGAFFSSATFAKNPAVMSLYFKTNITDAVPDLNKLESIIERGGVPLQQIMSNALVLDGQYLRRERTYEGIEMNLEQLPTDPGLAADSAKSLREIFSLDQNVMTDVRDAYIDALQGEGMGVAADGAVGEIGASSTNFSSIMHNAVNQVLLAIKAEAVVNAAIEAHKRGEKPIIALSNTNASIMEDYAEEMDISTGDPFEVPFNEILRRYIERLRRITTKDENDKKEHIRLSDSDVETFGGPFALHELKRVEALVDKVDFHGMPASPIDYIRDKLEAAGVRTGEVTGRGKIIKDGTYEGRDSSAAANKGAMNDYNSGALDALIINRSGATGFSLHATEKNDGKVRHMFILQPDPNIDTFMQMLGRVNRTGQIKLPKYTIAVSDLAVEKRPAAVLMRKMASLNANTTASKKSAVSLDNVTDFMNKYGDAVVLDYLRENPELAAITGVKIPAKQSEATGLAAKFTGKLAILNPEETARVFDDIEALYTAYIEELDSLGQNALEAKALPLDARTLKRTVISEGENPASAFGADTVLEDLDVKVIGKPYTPEQVEEHISKVIGDKDQHAYVMDQIRQIDEMAPKERAKLEKARPDLQKRLKEAKTETQKDKAQDAINRLDARLAGYDGAVDELKNLVHNFRPGRAVMVNVLKGAETVDTVYGIALGLDLEKMKGRLTALSRAGVRIALASPARELRVPASRFVGDESAYDILNANDATVMRAFESGQTEAREQRQIVTGNIVTGLDKFSRGQIVMFTREDGSQDNGILMPADFNARKALEDRNVVFNDIDHAIQFVDKAGTREAPSMLKSEDGVMSVQRSFSGYVLLVGRKGGKPYILSPKVRELIGDFAARSGPYRKTISNAATLKEVLQVYKDTLGTTLVTDAHKDQAREITGETLPDFGDGDLIDGAKHSRRKPAALNAPASGRSEANFSRDEVADMTKALNAQLKRIGLAGKVKAKAWAAIKDGPFALEGIYRAGEIGVAAGPGAVNTMRHEVIHALRDAKLWGREYGLFSRDEWRSLVKAARKRKDLMGQVSEGYPDLSSREQVEEVIAEMYREWGAKRDAETPLAKTFRRISDALKAVASALRGRGYVGASRIFEAIESGEVGGRGPNPDGNGPKGGQPKFSVSKSVRDQISAIWTGKSPDRPVLIGRLPAVFRALTGKDNPLVISSKVIRKAGNHGLTEQDVVAAVEGLNEPVMVFDSTNESGNLTALVAAPALDGRPLVAAIDAEYRAGRIEVSRIATIHGKDHVGAILGWMRDGYVRYIDKKKAGDWSRSIGRQLPKEATVHRRNVKILQRHHVFKTDGSAKHRRKRNNPGFEAGPFVNASSLADGAQQLASDALTQAMAGKNGTNILALVPGRALMEELGGKMPAVKTYLGLKEKMDTLRNERHARTDELAQKWRKLIGQDHEANTDLMDLMHDSTIQGQDPSKPFMRVSEDRDPYIVMKYGLNTKTGRAAQDRMDKDDANREAYDELRERFMALPAEFRDMYAEVRDAYEDLADEFDQAIEANAEKAMTVAIRRAERDHEKRLEEINDDGLIGKERKEAIEEADAILKTAKMQHQWSKNARLASLRKRFESNKLEGPYFPLARFGDFYVTLRDAGGKVVSFSRFEKARDQRKFAAEQEAEGFNVETGVMKDMLAREAVDPGFVADVEGLLEEIDADNQVMDAVWQRWLQTLPDMSMRKSKIHRKGTPGYSGDAFRAFGKQMFHGAHQLARLTYSLDMAEALEVAEQEARHSQNPERNGLIVKEAARRHEYIMNPQGSAWAQAMTSAAFVYYLSMTPAAAMVNLSQTTVVGIPMLGAYWGKGGQAKAAKELTRAMQDFARGKFHAADSKRLTSDEKRAMQDAYDRGTIDKSQAHDLAGVGETGVEYSPVRTKVMGVISFMFHHAERANREVTFLAAYRMAKGKGLNHSEAVERAADLTWKTHFDYQNTSRPRLLQNDYMRVAMVFRNFQINMLWRLFRDTHQALHGESAAVRTEARRQLVGISAQMLLHAGVKGVWGYSILKMMAGLFFAGGGDEFEKEMEKALLAVLPREVVGAMLNGVPGHLTGVDLRSRVGMPDLWFRSPDRQLEGEDEYSYWMQQLLGAVPGMVQNVHRGTQQIADGHEWRGVETIMPKAIRDVMRSGRYWYEGAQTYNGDPIIESFRANELLAQVLGFTPARLSERYDANTRMKNEEKAILDDRRSIMRDAGDAARDGRGIPDSVFRDIERFNEDNPTYPITNKSLRRSIKSREKASERNEFGVQLNQKLNRRIRDDAAPLIYSD